MKRGQLARETGINVRNIDALRQRGELPFDLPEQKTTMARYTPDQVERMMIVGRLEQMGFGLATACRMVKKHPAKAAKLAIFMTGQNCWRSND